MSHEPTKRGCPWSLGCASSWANTHKGETWGVKSWLSLCQQWELKSCMRIQKMGTPTLQSFQDDWAQSSYQRRKGIFPHMLCQESWKGELGWCLEKLLALLSWADRRRNWKAAMPSLPCLQHLLACSFPERRFPTELHVRPVLRTCLMAQKCWGMLWQCSAVCTVRKNLFSSLDSKMQPKTLLLFIRFLPGFLQRCGLDIRTFYPEFALWEDAENKFKNSLLRNAHLESA